MVSSNGFDHYPYFASRLDEFLMIGKLPLNLKLDHEAFFENNVLVISAEEESKTTMQNPSSSYSSSSNSYSSSSTKPPAISDEMRNLFFPPEEDFLQNPAPLMTKIDREYLYWQQQMAAASLQLARTNIFQGFRDQNKVMDLENVDEMSVTTARPVEKPADLHVESEEKRGLSDERVAKSVEMRQKRMIKNRESAARSRARKQAYIDHLQNKVSQLRILNNFLKKRKEVNSILNSKSISAPIYQLRRTSSSHI